jgi:predicted PurR-regulated permease PerM
MNKALTIIATVGVIALLRYAQDLFVPIVLAALIAYAVSPLVKHVEALRIPRALAALLVLAALISTIGYGMFMLRHQATVVLEGLPEAAVKLRQKIDELRGATAENGTINSIQEAAREIEKTAEAVSAPPAAPPGVSKVQVVEPALAASEVLVSGSLCALRFAGRTVLVVFLIFFLLASGDLVKRKIVRIAGTTLGEKRLTLETLKEIDGQIEHFLGVQMLTSTLVSIATALALWLLGLRQPIIWGVAAGIFNSVPYFGAIIVSTGLALLGFLQFESLGKAVEVAAVALVITSLEGFLLTPLLMGRAGQINGVAMFISILFWSWLWGIIGMIVAVPLTMTIKSVCDRVEQLQPIAELLSDR